ncbi:hypothetical protein BESB_076870 [Besnoitia besnoiti]|uniref:Uncharacterized protein n=1 Tax=Besnoitia besnoiti TaxID=94643 RepID=A0A2A9MDK4_BESBE|nr:hypothetical protein BESB_076870 [Besnoitia besnoiti]PFH33470.1 hypothetical protein BESB_076870 [Besnoitia besnoiti]
MPPVSSRLPEERGADRATRRQIERGPSRLPFPPQCLYSSAEGAETSTGGAVWWRSLPSLVLIVLHLLLLAPLSLCLGLHTLERKCRERLRGCPPHLGCLSTGLCRAASRSLSSFSYRGGRRRGEEEKLETTETETKQEGARQARLDSLHVFVVLRSDELLLLCRGRCISASPLSPLFSSFFDCDSADSLSATEAPPSCHCSACGSSAAPPSSLLRARQRRFASASSPHAAASPPSTFASTSASTPNPSCSRSSSFASFFLSSRSLSQEETGEGPAEELLLPSVVSAFESGVHFLSLFDAAGICLREPILSRLLCLLAADKRWRLAPLPAQSASGASSSLPRSSSSSPPEPSFAAQSSFSPRLSLSGAESSAPSPLSSASPGCVSASTSEAAPVEACRCSSPRRRARERGGGGHAAHAFGGRIRSRRRSFSPSPCRAAAGSCEGHDCKSGRSASSPSSDSTVAPSSARLSPAPSSFSSLSPAASYPWLPRASAAHPTSGVSLSPRLAAECDAKHPQEGGAACATWRVGPADPQEAIGLYSESAVSGAPAACHVPLTLLLSRRYAREDADAGETQEEAVPGDRGRGRVQEMFVRILCGCCAHEDLLRRVEPQASARGSVSSQASTGVVAIPPVALERVSAGPCARADEAVERSASAASCNLSSLCAASAPLSDSSPCPASRRRSYGGASFCAEREAESLAHSRIHVRKKTRKARSEAVEAALFRPQNVRSGDDRLPARDRDVSGGAPKRHAPTTEPTYRLPSKAVIQQPELYRHLACGGPIFPPPLCVFLLRPSAQDLLCAFAEAAAARWTRVAGCERLSRCQVSNAFLNLHAPAARSAEGQGGESGAAAEKRNLFDRSHSLRRFFLPAWMAYVKSPAFRVLLAALPQQVSRFFLWLRRVFCRREAARLEARRKAEGEDGSRGEVQSPLRELESGSRLCQPHTARPRLRASSAGGACAPEASPPETESFRASVGAFEKNLRAPPSSASWRRARASPSVGQLARLLLRALARRLVSLLAPFDYLPPFGLCGVPPIVLADAELCWPQVGAGAPYFCENATQPLARQSPSQPSSSPSLASEDSRRRHFVRGSSCAPNTEDREGGGGSAGAASDFCREAQRDVLARSDWGGASARSAETEGEQTKEAEMAYLRLETTLARKIQRDFRACLDDFLSRDLRFGR